MGDFPIYETTTKQQNLEETAIPETTVEARGGRLYSERVKCLPQKISQKSHTMYSKSAILVKRINTSLTLNNLRTILTRETRDKTTVQNIFCDIARDRNTLIIKAETEAETNEILKAIENIETLKDAIEITYKAENTKKNYNLRNTQNNRKRQSKKSYSTKPWKYI